MSTPPSGSVSHFFPFSFFFYDGIIKFMKRLYCILLAGFLLLLSFTPGISAADSDDVSFALRSEYKADHSRFLFSAESSAKDITSSCKLTVTGKHPNASVILGGDCNMSMTSVAYYTLVGNSLHDARKIAGDTTADGSYNAWDRTDVSKYALGDYIFAGDGVKVEKFSVLHQEDMDTASGKHISDHSPLVAQIKY